MFEKNREFCVKKAEKELFSVYQTIYSNADTNVKFDWKRRLNDTAWTEECYWIMKKDQKIGGILIFEDKTRFAFLIPPFNDRDLFWSIIHNHIRENNLKISKMYSVLDCDLEILYSFGYKVEFSRRMMFRPTDAFPLVLNASFNYRIPNINVDLDEIISVMEKGYKGSIDYSIFGIQTSEEIRKDVIRFFGMYEKTKSIDQSVIVIENETNKIVAVCLAGKIPEQSDWVSEITEIVVLPEYRNKGIAEFMIKNALTTAKKTSEMIAFPVTIGNYAERLYRKLGFIGRPRFSNMVLR
jgi:GNAT superfamily N-acetyltransferase